MGEQLCQSRRGVESVRETWTRMEKQSSTAPASRVLELLTRKHVKCELKKRKPKAEEKSNAGNFRCFRCNEEGHVVVNCPKPPTQGGKGKGKGKGKGQGKGKVDGNSEEEEKEK